MSDSEHRRFERVEFAHQAGQWEGHVGPRFLSLQQGWEVVVLNISLTGAALERPESEVHVGDVLNLQLKGDISVGLPSEIIWLGQSTIGVHFIDVNLLDRQRLEQFLTPYLAGANMYLVDKKFFSEKLDCQMWYTGPAESNLFIWLNNESSKVEKIKLSWGKGNVIWQDGQLLQCTGALEACIKILEQMIHKQPCLVPVLENIKS